MLDIGGRQQTYSAGRSYPQQDEPLSTNLECPQGSNRKDATPAVPASFSDSLSQPQCWAQPENSKQTSLFSSEEQQLLEQQLYSLPEGVPVCQCLTMTTNSRSSKISNSSTITTATITTSTTALSTLVQNQNVLQLAPNPMPPGQQSDTSFSFLSLAKHPTLKSSTSPSSSSFLSSSHQTQSQILQQQKPCFSMSPQTFPLQQYHFPANAALSSSRQCNTDSVDGEANIQGNPNGRNCSSEAADIASDLGGASRYMLAFITNKLKMQELIDDAIAPVANPPGYVHAVKDSQLCNVSVSPTTSWLYPSSPQKKPAAITDGGPDTWPSNSGQGSDLQATVQGLLGLRLGDRPDQSVAVSPHHLITSSSNDTNRSAYSGLIPPNSVALSSTSSPCYSVPTENPASDKLNDSDVTSSIGMATGSDTDSFTDMSPGTPPDPPKKKHCRSLSIPSGSSSSRSRRSTGLSTDHFKTTDFNRCCTSLWKPIAFTPVNDASNPTKVQQQQSLPFQHYSGQGTPPDVQKTSPFSLSTSPLSPNTGMSASLTSLLQPTSFGGLFSSAQISGPVSTNQNVSLSLAALVTTPASTSVSPSQLHVAPSQMPVTMLTSSPPPLALGKPSPQTQTQSSSCLQSPPDSPVPRPASVSVVGCRCEDDSDIRAFKPVLDLWLCRSQSRGNSGFSSPSSCSSSSSFLLVPPQSDPRSNTEIQSATIGGLLAAPVPLTQTPRSSPTCTPSSLSSPATVIGSTNSQAPLQPSYWPFQKHRSFSLEEQLSQMGKPTSTSPSSFFSPSPPSSSSSVLSSPSHYHHHHHHHPYHLPAPVFQTQQYQPSYPNHHQQHHLYHYHYQQQQPQQQQPPPPPPPPQTVSAGGSTPNVPVACKSSVSNPSSPRRQRIPRCRSQPCVLHDRREGRKRRRDYDRPTLDFHKMTQTAYSVSQPDSSGKSCVKQEQWTGLRQQTGDNAGLWCTHLVTTSTMNTPPRISALQPPGLISLEVLRKTDFLASEHGDDPLSEDAEISAATEAGEAAARAAAAAAATTTKTTTVATTTAAVDSTVSAAMTTTAVAMDDDDDEEDENWECRDLRRPALFGRAINPIGRDMSVYVSDESNPSFCGCDDDEEEEDDNDDDDNMDSDERMERGRNFQRTNQCMFPIIDLDLNQIENH